MRHSQFLNAILALEALASVDFLLAVRKVLGERCALGAVLALLLNGWKRLRHVKRVVNIK